MTTCERPSRALRALAWFHAHAWVRWPLAAAFMVAWWTWWVRHDLWWDALDETLGQWLALPTGVLVSWLELARLVLVVSSALFLAVLAGRYRRLLNGMLIASPGVLLPIYLVGDAVMGYAEGTAVYYSSGLPTVLGPHPRLGIPQRNTGCIVTSQSELREVVNNTTLELLVEHLGPMPKAEE